MAPEKEPHFFNEDTPRRIRQLREYERLFKGAESSHRAVGEASTGYLLSVSAVPNILRYNPNARFAAMLRNPLEMAPSLHQQRLYELVEDVSHFETAWRLQDERRRGRKVPSGCSNPFLLQYGTYCRVGAQVQRLLDTVGPDRCHFMFLDDIKEAPRREWIALLEFLGVADDGRTIFPVENAAKVHKYPGLACWILRIGAIRRKLFGRAFTFGILNRANRAAAIEGARPPLSRAMREELAEYFRDDIALLGNLTGRHLSHWLDARS